MSAFDEKGYPIPSTWTCVYCRRSGETPNGAVMVFHRCVRQTDDLEPRRFTIDELISITDGESPAERRAAMFAHLLANLS